LSIRRRDISTPEVLAQTEAPGQFKDDPSIRACLTARGDDRGTPLYQGLALLVDIKADLEGFAFPGCRHRQDAIGQSPRGRQEESGIDTKLQGRQRGRRAAGISVRDEQVGPEADETTHSIRGPFENGTIEVV